MIKREQFHPVMLRVNIVGSPIFDTLSYNSISTLAYLPDLRKMIDTKIVIATSVRLPP